MGFLQKLKSVVSNRQHEGGHGDLSSLKRVSMHRIIPERQINLSDQGWTSITYDGQDDPLQVAFQALLTAGQGFFDLPPAEKEQYRTVEGTEDGWNYVPGEKEFITLRTLGNTPPLLREPAARFWTEAGNFMNDLIGGVAGSLGLPAKALTIYSEPCASLGQERTASMLRLFRYEGFEGGMPKMVAEPHRDLGLISLAIGDTPGLEVWDRHAKLWYPLERDFTAGTLMVGRQLERLTNGRYQSGGHRVRSYPEPNANSIAASSTVQNKYRHSIVFVLRAHSPISIDTECLTTHITGQYRSPMRGITARDLFADIHDAHFNVNTTMEEREKQKQNLKMSEASKTS